MVPHPSPLDTDDGRIGSLPPSPNSVQHADEVGITTGKKLVGVDRDSIEDKVPALGDLDLSATPKNAPTSRLRFNSSLPTLDETAPEQSFEDDAISTSHLSDTSTKMSKRSAKSTRSLKGKTNRLRTVQALQKEATELAHTGQEEEAQKIYLNAVQIAGSEIARINFKIRKSQKQHEATRGSIQARHCEDLRKVGIVIGKIRTKMAILYERSGDYSRSIACCKEATEIYKHQPVVGDSGKVDSSGELVELMNLMIDRLDLASKALSGRPVLLKEIGDLRRKIAKTVDVRKKKKLYAEVEASVGIVKQMEIAALGDAHPQVADTLQLLSTILLEQNKEAGAIEHLQQAIKISRGSLGARHPRTGQYNLRLARIHLNQGIESLALECFREATDVLAFSPKFTRVLGSTLNDVAVIYMRRREYDLAIVNLQDALYYYKRSQEHPDEPDAPSSKERGLSIDTLQVYRNLGECYMKKQNFEMAKESFYMVLELQQSARKVYDNVVDLGLGIIGVERLLQALIDDESIADTLMRLGRVAAAGADHREALILFKEAMHVLEQIGIDEEIMGNACAQTEKQREVRKDNMTNTLYCIAEESCVVGDYDEALRAYGESMRLRCFRGARTPQEKQSHVINCTLCFAGIAGVYLKKKDYAVAHKRLNDTLRYCRTEGVPTNHPLYSMVKQKIRESEALMAADAEIRNTKLQELVEKAEDEIGVEDYSQALSTLQEAMAMRRIELVSLKASGRDATEQIYDIANMLRTYGSVFERMGDEENARRAYLDATTLFKKSGDYENITV